MRTWHEVNGVTKKSLILNELNERCDENFNCVIDDFALPGVLFVGMGRAFVAVFGVLEATLMGDVAGSGFFIWPVSEGYTDQIIFGKFDVQTIKLNLS